MYKVGELAYLKYNNKCLLSPKIDNTIRIWNQLIFHMHNMYSGMMICIVQELTFLCTTGYICAPLYELHCQLVPS